jgi:hypothetical protein
VVRVTEGSRTSPLLASWSRLAVSIVIFIMATETVEAESIVWRVRASKRRGESGGEVSRGVCGLLLWLLLWRTCALWVRERSSRLPSRYDRLALVNEMPWARAPTRTHAHGYTRRQKRGC